MTQMQPPVPSPVTTRFCSSSEDGFFHRAFLMACPGSSSLIPRKTLGTKIIITSSTQLLLLMVSSLPAFLALKQDSASFPNVRAILNKTSILFHLAYSWEPDAWFPPSGRVISPRVRSRSRGKPHCAAPNCLSAARACPQHVSCSWDVATVRPRPGPGELPEGWGLSTAAGRGDAHMGYTCPWAREGRPLPEPFPARLPLPHASVQLSPHLPTPVRAPTPPGTAPQPCPASRTVPGGDIPAESPWLQTRGRHPLLAHAAHPKRDPSGAPEG